MDELDRAQRVAPVFDSRRLLAVRELIGGIQKEIAVEAGITPSALSQAERGLSKPTAATLSRLADVLGVPVEAFSSRPEPTTGLPPQFRHLSRTPQKERKRAARLVEAAGAIADVVRSRVDLPAPFEFQRAIDPRSHVEEVAEEIETIAVAARAQLGLDSAAPLGSDLIGVLEGNGIVVVRDVETDEAIDAYSAVVNQQPIVILDGGTDSVWDRDNFNLAHELGHLVLHRSADHRPGTRTVERQAHRFAGAFLAPETPLRQELPRTLDWTGYLELKFRWGLSIAALVHRAHDLGVIDGPTYTRAMKQRSAYGWRRTEPGNDLRPLPQPSLLAEGTALAGLSVDDLSMSAGLPTSVVARILGPGPRPVVRA